MKIPPQRFDFSPKERRFLHEGLDTILDTGGFTLGRYTREFETNFAAQLQVAHAVSCNSGTSALELILRALEIEGKRVIVPTNTFLATALAVIHSGNEVVFADSAPSTLCLDPVDLERRITPDTAAVILVHIGGIITPEIHRIQELCRQHSLALIEDCAHAHYCRLAGQAAGTFGIAGAFSFFPTKVLTTGEGGMVTTNDPHVAERVRSLRNHGKVPELKGHIAHLGNNYRMSEITALLGVQQTQNAAQRVDARRRVAEFYDRELTGVEGLAPLKLPEALDTTYYKYIAYLDQDLDRDAIKETLRDRHGISLPSEVYADLCHDEPVWENFTLCGKARATLRQKDVEPQTEPFPGAAFLSRHHLCLPIYPGLTQEELEHVVKSLRGTLAEVQKGSACES